MQIVCHRFFRDCTVVGRGKHSPLFKMGSHASMPVDEDFQAISSNYKDKCKDSWNRLTCLLHCFELREEEERRQPQRYRKIPVLQRLVRRRQCLWLIQEAASSNGFHVFFILVHYVFDVVLPSCSHMSKYEHLWQSDLEGGEAWQFTPLMQSLDHDAPTLRQR